MAKQSAKVIAHSVCAETGKEIITWEIEYWRGILAELNKHRMFSKNDQSSRAVPLDQAIKRCWSDPFYPVYWGGKKSGMQAGEQLSGFKLSVAKSSWWAASKSACIAAWLLDKVGLHKQHSARLLEPFLTMKGVITATEVDNFFFLRIDKDAQPEIDELARLMLIEMEISSPVPLEWGEWHLPYFYNGYWSPYDNFNTTLEDAIKISAASCAQISFRKLDQSPEKVERVWKRLVEGEKLHAVCLEHQSTPVGHLGCAPMPEGCTHRDVNMDVWSGNFNGFVQYRKIFESSQK